MAARANRPGAVHAGRPSRGSEASASSTGGEAEEPTEKESKQDSAPQPQERWRLGQRRGAAGGPSTVLFHGPSSAFEAGPTARCSASHAPWAGSKPSGSSESLRHPGGNARGASSCSLPGAAGGSGGPGGHPWHRSDPSRPSRSAHGHGSHRAKVRGIPHRQGRPGPGGHQRCSWGVDPDRSEHQELRMEYGQYLRHRGRCCKGQDDSQAKGLRIPASSCIIDAAVSLVLWTGLVTALEGEPQGWPRAPKASSGPARLKLDS
eukprot:s2317_g3.t1